MPLVESTSSSVPPWPPPPRALTPAARRRSWAEAPVRGWMVLAALVAIATAYFTVRQTLTALADRRLINSGSAVSARITSTNGITNDTRRAFDRRETNVAELEYIGPNGITYKPTGTLTPTSGVIHIGETIPLHVD